MRIMLRIAILALLSSALCLAQDQDFSKVEIKVTKVAGTVYMLQGAGGNIGASVGDDGIVVVDDQYAPLAERIQAALKGITDKPVRFIINTHYHHDHTGGNEFFQKQAPIIAHDNVRKRLEEGSMAGNGGSLQVEHKPQPKGALPIITFDHDVTVHLNGEDIRALHFPAGHTDGDSVIYFPKSNVVHMGDDFVTYGFPFIDIDGGGSIDGMIDGVEGAIAKLKDTRAVVADALKKNMTLAQMKEEKILDPWKKYSGDFLSEDAFLETLFNSLTGQKNRKFIKHN